MGVKYEGRYFFSSVESLTASYTCLEKHYLKCSQTPEDVKTTVVKTRATHASQRKGLKVGSQQAYFNDLWARYKVTKVAAKLDASHAFAGVVPSQIKMQPIHNIPEREEKVPMKEFSNHVRLIASLGKGEADDDLQEALDRYYACLEYGGRVYMTKEMPKHFSSAWLVAKIVPKEYLQPELSE